ncbi:MAG: MFS transporter [Phycisphaerae bacterium]|nr:MFS transporter [Phycisphaerae bacterium]NNF44129.1 MFS transporter [Phycisphaerales bacterium]
MLFRFSLYGFLKNQRYFEAYLVLAFLEKGLDFFQIGLLIAVREATVNLLEVPSGALADIWGRRRCLIVAFAAYLVAFLTLGATASIWTLAGGMFLYGIGESFRSGTHKALIFAWLRRQDRTDERTRVYGYTRSWSKIGSAVSVILATGIVLLSDGYALTFTASAVPCLAGILNFLGYPATLDTPQREAGSRGVVRHMLETVRTAIRRRPLRRLVFESMGFDGVFGAVKDYLQPVLEAAAVATALGLGFGADGSAARRTALLVGPVYVGLFLLASMASRRAHRVATRLGGEAAGSARLWQLFTIACLTLLVADRTNLTIIVVASFIALHVLHNLWRPMLVSRFDAHGKETHGASLLSVESQARHLTTMILAPLLGLAIDAATEASGTPVFWPIGVVGVVVGIVFVGVGWRAKVDTRPS